MPLLVVVAVAAAGLAIVSLSVCAKGFSRAHLRPNNNSRHQAPKPPTTNRPSTIHIPVSLSTLFFIWPHWQRLVYDNFLWLIVFDYTCRCRANNNNKISQWRQHQCRYLSILVYGYLWVSYCSGASSTRFPFL